MALITKQWAIAHLVLPMFGIHAKVGEKLSDFKGNALTETRAPRFGKLEIPLMLITEDNKPLSCSCINISSTGAFLCLVDHDIDVAKGMTFRTKIRRDGVLTEIKLVVERIESSGVGVRFLAESAG